MARGRTVNVSPAILRRATLVRSTERDAKPITELVQEGLVHVNPEFAKRILNEAIYNKQRAARIMHIRALAQQMRNREWTQGTQVHFGRLPDGSLHLVNGQHRLIAVVESDQIVQFQFLITDVANDAGLNTLYRRHDRLAVGRTVADALNAEGVFDKHKIGREMAGAVFGAVVVINNGFVHHSQTDDVYVRRSDEARLRLAEQWWEYAIQYADCIENAPASPIKKKLRNFGVTAVALVTLRYQNDKADAFWRGVGDNDRLNRNDPRSAYLRFLNAPVARGSGVHNAKAAATAWNAFYSDESREVIRIAGGPVSILGTPYEQTMTDIEI